MAGPQTAELKGGRDTITDTQRLWQRQKPSESMWICGGNQSTEGEVARVWSWDGHISFKTNKDKTVTTEACFVPEPPISDNKGHPLPRTASSACVLMNRLFCLGGYSEEFGALQSVLSISKHSQLRQWRREKESMNSRREGLAACSFQDVSGYGYIMAMGGTNGSQGMLSSCEQASMSPAVDGVEYDLNKFVELPDMPIKRTNATACVLFPNVKTGDPHVYAIGGFSEGGQVTDRVDVFKSTTHEWESSKPLKQARALHASCAHENRVFVAGGMDGNASLTSVESFDAREGRWRPHVPFTSARAGLCMVYMDYRLILFGGRSYYDSIAVSSFQSGEKAQARQDIRYKQKRLKEYPDTIEILDLRSSMPKWEQLQVPTYKVWTEETEGNFYRAIELMGPAYAIY